MSRSRPPRSFVRAKLARVHSASGWWQLESRSGWLVVTASVLVLSLWLGSAGVALPLERDEGEYAYIAWRWLEGEVPYVESFDQKPPGIFAVYALIFVTLGRTPAAIHWGAILYTLPTLLLLMSLARCAFGPRVAGLAGAFAAIATAGPGFFAGAANTEIFALLPLVGGLWLGARAARRDDLPTAAASGAAAAIALLFKWVVVPLLAFQLVFHLFSHMSSPPLEPRRRALHAAAAVAGGLVPLLMTLGYFAWVGGLGAFVDATLLYNLQYATRLGLSEYPTLLALQSEQFLPTLWPIFAAALLLPLVWLASRGQRAWVPAQRRAERWLWGWVLAAAASLAAGGYFRPHYFIFAVPPLSILAALGIMRALSFARVPARHQSAAGLLCVALVVGQAWAAAPWYFAAGPAAAKARKLYDWNPFPESREIAAFIAERSRPEDRIYIFGSEPQIFFYAERRSATRYIYAYPLTMPGPGVEERQRQVLAELVRDPPRFIVSIFSRKSLLEEESTPRVLRAGLLELVRSGYHPIGFAPQRGDGRTHMVTHPSELDPLKDGMVFTRTSPKPQLIVWERS